MKQSLTARILCGLLAGTFVIGTFVGCSNSEKKEAPAASSTQSGETETTPAETEPEVTGRAAVKDELPEKQFDGRKYIILSRVGYEYEFGVTGENGEVLNDAVYQRNRTVEERFKVKINNIAQPCNWDDQATAFNTALSASIMAGDGAYDVVAGYAAAIPPIVASGIFTNWLDIPYIDFTQPWWSEGVCSEMTINNKCFMATGDASLSLWTYITCFFFNKRLAESNKLPDIYNIVSEGKWTLDKLIELTKGTYKDVNGDGQYGTEDTYGFITFRNTEIDAWKEALEINVTKKGDDGFPTFDIVSERAVGAVEKLYAYITASGDAYMTSVTGNAGSNLIVDMFKTGHGLFFASRLQRAQSSREMEDDFGIIPYPKYDEAQKLYHATSIDNFTLFLVPKDVKDAEFTGIMTTAVMAESYKTVIPTFYDIVLKTKSARDEESAAMIDLCREGLTFNFGYLYSTSMDNVGHIFGDAFRYGSTNIVSTFESGKTAFNSKLADILKVYR